MGKIVNFIFFLLNRKIHIYQIEETFGLYQTACIP